MSKNMQATFWASLALVSVIVAVVAIKRQLPARPAIHKASAKTSASSPISKVLADIFSPNAVATQAPAAATTTTATSTSTSTKATSWPRRKPKTADTQISYGEAVANYGNNRIQFTPDCQAVPSNMAVANPVTLMLDNRSGLEQKITIGGKVYGVAAYNYVIVTINEKTLPQNLFITCNQRPNVAEIILQ